MQRLLEEKELLLEIPQEEDYLFQTEVRKIEGIIISLEALCFKHELSAAEFFDRVCDQYSLADKLGVSLLDLPTYVKRLEDDVDRLIQEIHRLQLETEKEVERRGTTMNLLEELKQSKPLFELTKKELEKAKEERDS